jgi:hypothetical protein
VFAGSVAAGPIDAAGSGEDDGDDAGSVAGNTADKPSAATGAAGTGSRPVSAEAWADAAGIATGPVDAATLPPDSTAIATRLRNARRSNAMSFRKCGQSRSALGAPASNGI